MLPIAAVGAGEPAHEFSLRLLREAGCAEKPVWSAEIYSGFLLMEPLVLSNWTLQAWPVPSRSLEYVKILKKPKDPRFEEVNAWYRGLHAAQVVKICMVALDAGSEKLMMGWAVDAQNPLAVSTLSHHGLYSMTFNHLWPAAYTYDLVIRKLDGLKRIERLRMPENVYVYRCSVKSDKAGAVGDAVAITGVAVGRVATVGTGVGVAALLSITRQDARHSSRSAPTSAQRLSFDAKVFLLQYIGAQIQFAGRICSCHTVPLKGTLADV